MKTTIYSCIVLVFLLGSCKIYRGGTKQYVGDKDGYYNWDLKLSSSGLAKYYVIVGSFPDEDSAQQLKEKLNLNGYPAIILPQENGKIRVSLGVYAFKDNAEKMKESYAKKNPGVKPWIFSR